MNRRPSFPFYASDFLGDSKVQAMTCEEIGAYLLLLLYQWQEGTVPAETSRWARICRVSSRRLSAMLAALEPCFPAAEDGCRRNLRMQCVREDSDAYASSRASAAHARWSKRDDAYASVVHPPRTTYACDEQMRSVCLPTPSPSPEERHPPLPPPVEPPAQAEAERKPAQPDGCARSSRSLQREFADFWGKYPRKRSRGAALKAFEVAVIRANVPLADVLAGIGRAEIQWARERRPSDKVPYPATWLRAQGWLDETDSQLPSEPEATPAPTEEEMCAAMERLCPPLPRLPDHCRELVRRERDQLDALIVDVRRRVMPNVFEPLRRIVAGKDGDDRLVLVLAQDWPEPLAACVQACAHRAGTPVLLDRAQEVTAQ